MPDCSGPCLPWCSCPMHVTVLAYLALAYTGASIGYLLMTRDIGTPFADSLTEHQREIKKQSSSVRKSAFYRALGITVLVLAMWRPLRRM